MKKIVLFVTVLVLASCSGGRNSTGYSLINDMMYSEAHEANTLNNSFDNGLTNQQPPKGTIARGKMPQDLDAEGNPVVMSNPHVMDDYAWQRGKMLYESTCSACHGVEGKADGLVVTKGGFPKPPSFKARKWKKVERYPSGYVYNVITYGYGNMASHAQQLYPIDRWHVAEYVRQKLMKKRRKK